MSHQDFSNLKALFLNCSLKSSKQKSHTQGLLDVAIKIMKKEGVSVECVRTADYAIATGIQPDMREHGAQQDAWPEVFEKAAEADILVLGTPIWLGERSSEASRVIERLYAMSGKRNEQGQYFYYGKVGGCVITGNEDGAKHCAMGILYALQHLGYSVPPQADCAWIGEIGPGPSYLDEGSGGIENDFTNRNTTFMAYNLMHLASLLKARNGYPPYGNSVADWENGKRWAFANPEYR
ncbi:MAG: flavodoxin family protein [Bacteroidota bacterium]